MTFTLKAKLQTTEKDRAVLNHRFFLMFHAHNKAVEICQRRLRVRDRDKEYARLLEERKVLKKSLKAAKKDNNASTVEQLQKELDALDEKLSAKQKAFGLTMSEVEKIGKVHQHRHKDEISSVQMQKEMDHIYKGVSECTYGKGKKLSFMSWNDMNTISQKDMKNGIKVRDNHIEWGNGKHKLIIPFEFEEDDEYAQEALTHELKYVEITRLEFSTGWRYYINMYLDGEAPQKYQHGEGTTGIDPGVSTVAAVNEDNALLEELAPAYLKYDRQIKEIQRKIERSKRKLNPQNYNEDGTVKKGRHEWKKSKNCLRLERQKRILYRKQTAYTETEHRRIINKILRKSKIVINEHMNWSALSKRSKKTERQDKESTVLKKNGEVQMVRKYKRKKRYGRSIRNRSPGKFVTFLKQKSKAYGVLYFEVDTKSYKASQLNHTTGEYEKVPLTQRVKTINGEKVQRDLYSAFLISNAIINLSEKLLTTPDLERCKQLFNRFVEVQNETIKQMKQQGISYRACFGF